MKGSMVRLVYATMIFVLALSVGMIDTSAAPQDFTCSTVTEIPQIECEALVALYNSTTGENWTDNTNWLEAIRPATWYGVTVSAGHVTRLELPDNLLSGTIPFQLSNLANLIYLNLNYNQLSGSIPPQLGSLTNLTELDLSENQLSGSIPAQLGSLVHLSDLWLKGNSLSGSIPPELGSLANLTYMNLSYNQLSSSIPAQLGSLVNLNWLALHMNQLSGSIPPQLGSLANLGGLVLTYNQLNGSIPPELGNLANLTLLWLNSNDLSGSIPAELANLANLAYLDLSRNQLNSIIPPQLGNLGNIIELDLHGNQLSGSIPSQLGSTANLQSLDLSYNLLTGSIPLELGSLPSLVEMLLHENHLSGSIPPELANLPFIYTLNLNYNWLTVPDPYPSDPPTPLELFLMQYAPGWETTQGIAVEIPVSGGQVQSRDERILVTVPAGGVTQPVTLVLTSLVEPTHSTGDWFFANTSFNLAAYDADGILISPFTFALPVTVSLSYLDSDVTGQDESQLILYDWDVTSSAWLDAAQTCTPPSIYQRDLVTNTLSLPVCHLTEFALLIKTTSQISGQVTDGTNPIQDVIISDGNSHSTITDAAGNYTLPDLLPGTYTLTPTKSGYSFVPISQELIVTTADQIGINFTGTVIQQPEYKIYLPDVVN